MQNNYSWKEKAMFQKIYFNLNALVLVLSNVFIVSYGIAKCIREIIRGSVMCHYLTTNELIKDRMNTLYNIMFRKLVNSGIILPTF